MSDVPRPKSSNDTHINLALPGDWLEEASELVEPLSEPGITLSRADVLRKALRRGLDMLQREARKRDKP